MERKFNLEKRLRLGEMIRSSFENGFHQIGKNTVGALLFVLMESLLLLLIAFVAMVVFGMNYQYLGVSASLSEIDQLPVALMVVIGLLLYIFLLIPMFWMNIYSIHLGVQRAKNEPTPILKAIEQGFVKLPRFLLLTLISLPVLALIVGPALVAGFPTMIDPTAPISGSYMASIGWEYLGMLILSPIYLLTVAFLVDQRMSVWQSIKKAFEMAKAQYVRAVLYVFVVFLVGILALYAAILLIIIVGAILYFVIKPAVVALIVCGVVIYIAMLVYMMGFTGGLVANLYKQLVLEEIEEPEASTEVEL